MARLSAPLVGDDAVFDLDEGGSGLFLGAASAEDQKDGAVGVLVLGVFVFPDLTIALLHFGLFTGVAQRRLHPGGGAFARLDSGEGAVGDVVAADMLFV